MNGDPAAFRDLFPGVYTITALHHHAAMGRVGSMAASRPRCWAVRALPGFVWRARGVPRSFGVCWAVWRENAPCPAWRAPEWCRGVCAGGLTSWLFAEPKQKGFLENVKQNSCLESVVVTLLHWKCILYFPPRKNTNNGWLPRSRIFVLQSSGFPLAEKPCSSPCSRLIQ